MGATNLCIADWVALAEEVATLSRSAGSGEGERRVRVIGELALGTVDEAHLAQQVELLCSVAIFHLYSTSDSREALEPAQAALALAKRLRKTECLRRALTIYALVCADTSNVGMAFECYSTALSLAVELGNARAQCSVLANLGTALMIAADYQAAIECSGRAITLAEMTANDDVVVHIGRSARSNIALCHFHLEQLDAGIDMIRSALWRLTEPTEGYEFIGLVLMEYTHTRLLLKAGQLREARTSAARALRYSRAWEAPRASIAAQNAIALCEVFEGAYEAGMRRLNRSLGMAKTLRASHRDTLAALVMASEQSNRIDLALGYQRELLEVTNRAVVDNVRYHTELHNRAIVQRSSASDQHLIAKLAKRRFDRLTEQSNQYDQALGQLEILERIAATAAMREDPSGGHPYRVARLVSLLGEELGLDSPTCRALDLAARLHDIGNVGIPDRIALSRDAISMEDRSAIEAHTLLGFELLDKHDGFEVRLAAIIARGHHERWDGRGYPDKLSGSQIPLIARMTGIAESYDALTHSRPYRAAYGARRALDLIQSEAGGAFDPSLTTAFAGLVAKLQSKHRVLDEFLESGARASRYLQSRREIGEMLGQ